MSDQTYKQDQGKLPVSAVPAALIEAVAEIRRYGLTKYPGRYGYRSVSPDRILEAMERHMVAMWDPENMLKRDPESGLPHLWHVACNAAFLCDLLHADLMACVDHQPRCPLLGEESELTPPRLDE